MNTQDIAKRLVALCREGKFEDAQRELYAQDATSVEPENMSQGELGNVRGLEAIYRKGEVFMARVEQVHGIEVSDPLVAGDWFSMTMILDLSMKEVGRMNMSEICVYHVKNGKIDHEQFFYDAG